MRHVPDNIKPVPDFAMELLMQYGEHLLATTGQKPDWYCTPCANSRKKAKEMGLI
jgi:hypothetical protein